mmetsp:Transcript_15900/g.41064  ORF Transcript_15900/g.41064 Transcript_15900/m.41064 type:complete len:225 (-) Transcript_15900:1007-1681(-)
MTRRGSATSMSCSRTHTGLARRRCAWASPASCSREITSRGQCRRAPTSSVWTTTSPRCCGRAALSGCCSLCRLGAWRSSSGMRAACWRSMVPGSGGSPPPTTRCVCTWTACRRATARSTGSSMASSIATMRLYCRRSRPAQRMQNGACGTSGRTARSSGIACTRRRPSASASKVACRTSSAAATWRRRTPRASRRSGKRPPACTPCSRRRRLRRRARRARRRWR